MSTPRPSRFTPVQDTIYALYSRLGGPQGRYGWLRKISSPPPIRIRAPDHSYNVYAAPAGAKYGNVPITVPANMKTICRGNKTIFCSYWICCSPWRFVARAEKCATMKRSTFVRRRKRFCWCHDSCGVGPTLHQTVLSPHVTLGAVSEHGCTVKVFLIHQLMHRGIVLKTILKFTLKFTLKQLRHVSVQSHHHQGAH